MSDSLTDDDLISNSSQKKNKVDISQSEHIIASGILHQRPLSNISARILIMATSLQLFALSLENSYLLFSKRNSGIDHLLIGFINFMTSGAQPNINNLAYSQNLLIAFFMPYSLILLLTLIGNLVVSFTKKRPPKFLLPYWIPFHYVHLFIFMCPMNKYCFNIIYQSIKQNNMSSFSTAQMAVFSWCFFAVVLNVLVIIFLIQFSLQIKTRDPFARVSDITLNFLILRMLTMTTLNVIANDTQVEAFNDTLVALNFLLSLANIITNANINPFYQKNIRHMFSIFLSPSQSMGIMNLIQLIYEGNKSQSSTEYFVLRYFLLMILLIKVEYSLSDNELDSNLIDILFPLSMQNTLSFEIRSNNLALIRRMAHLGSEDLNIKKVMVRLQDLYDSIVLNVTPDPYLPVHPRNEIIKAGYLRLLVANSIDQPSGRLGELSRGNFDVWYRKDQFLAFLNALENRLNNVQIKLAIANILIDHYGSFEKSHSLLMTIISKTSDSSVKLSAWVMHKNLEAKLESSFRKDSSSKIYRANSLKTLPQGGQLVDLKSYFNVMDDYRKIKALIENQVLKIRSLFDYLGSQSPEFTRIIREIKAIVYLRNKIRRKWDRLDPSVPQKYDMFMLTYGLYLTVINFENTQGFKIIRQSKHIIKRNAVARTLDRGDITDLNIFSKDNVTVLAKISRNMPGRMMQVSPNCQKIFGANPNELQGKTITALMPQIYHQFHNKVIYEKIKSDELILRTSSIQGFGLNARGFIFPVSILNKINPYLSQGLLFWGMIKPSLSDDNDYMIINETGLIEGATEYISHKLGFEPNQEVFIQKICPEFALLYAQNQTLQSKGITELNINSYTHIGSQKQHMQPNTPGTFSPKSPQSPTHYFQMKKGTRVFHFDRFQTNNFEEVDDQQDFLSELKKQGKVMNFYRLDSGIKNNSNPQSAYKHNKYLEKSDTVNSNADSAFSRFQRYITKVGLGVGQIHFFVEVIQFLNYQRNAIVLRLKIDRDLSHQDQQEVVETPTPRIKTNSNKHLAKSESQKQKNVRFDEDEDSLFEIPLEVSCHQDSEPNQALNINLETDTNQDNNRSELTPVDVPSFFHDHTQASRRTLITDPTRRSLVHHSQNQIFSLQDEPPSFQDYREGPPSVFIPLEQTNVDFSTQNNLLTISDNNPYHTQSNPSQFKNPSKQNLGGMEAKGFSDQNLQQSHVSNFINRITKNPRFSVSNDDNSFRRQVNNYQISDGLQAKPIKGMQKNNLFKALIESDDGDPDNGVPAIASSIAGFQFKRIEDFHHVIPSLSLAQHHIKKAFLIIMVILILIFIISSLLIYSSLGSQKSNIQSGIIMIDSLYELMKSYTSLTRTLVEVKKRQYSTSLSDKTSTYAVSQQEMKTILEQLRIASTVLSKESFKMEGSNHQKLFQRNIKAYRDNFNDILQATDVVFENMFTVNSALIGYGTEYEKTFQQATSSKQYAEDYLYTNLNGEILKAQDYSKLVVQDLNTKMDSAKNLSLGIIIALCVIVLTSMGVKMFVFAQTFQETRSFLNMFLKTRARDFEVVTVNLDFFLKVISEDNNQATVNKLQRDYEMYQRKKDDEQKRRLNINKEGDAHKLRNKYVRQLIILITFMLIPIISFIITDDLFFNAFDTVKVRINQNDLLNRMAYDSKIAAIDLYLILLRSHTYINGTMVGSRASSDIEAITSSVSDKLGVFDQVTNDFLYQDHCNFYTSSTSIPLFPTCSSMLKDVAKKGLVPSLIEIQTTLRIQLGIINAMTKNIPTITNYLNSDILLSGSDRLINYVMVPALDSFTASQKDYLLNEISSRVDRSIVIMVTMVLVTTLIFLFLSAFIYRQFSQERQIVVNLLSLTPIEMINANTYLKNYLTSKSKYIYNYFKTYAHRFKGLEYYADLLQELTL